MKRVALATISTVVALVLLLSFKIHQSPAATSSLAATAPVASTPASSAGGSADSTTPSPTSTKSSSKTRARSYTGSAADTRYGPVQVTITVKDGKITAATANEYPSTDPRDAQINAFAIPQLNAEAEAATSAHIDTVSGATYTSGGYISSLQSALDKAGL